MNNQNLKVFSPNLLTTDQKLEQVIQKLDSIETRLSALEQQMSKLPDPFVIYYREPGKEEYSKLNEALDNLYHEIGKLKDGNSQSNN